MDLGDGEVTDSTGPAQDHGVDRRQTFEVQRTVARVRRIPVGEQEHAGERLARVAFRQAAQAGAQGRGAPVEREFGEIARGLKAGAKQEPADFEVVGQDGLPAGMRIEALAQHVGARSGCAAVLDPDALAVVGGDDEQVGAGPGMSSGPERLEQAAGERHDAERFQNDASQTRPIGRSARVAPDERGQANGHEEHRGPEPAGTRYGELGHGRHLSLFVRALPRSS